jgi:hypothetical protein
VRLSGSLGFGTRELNRESFLTPNELGPVLLHQTLLVEVERCERETLPLARRAEIVR